MNIYELKKKINLETAFFFVGWLISLIILFTYKFSLISLLLIIVIPVLLFFALTNSFKALDLKTGFLTKTLVALSLLGVLFTGGISSPIFPLLLGTLIFYFINETKPNSLFNVAIIFLIILIASYLITKNFLLPYLKPFLFLETSLFGVFIYLYLLNTLKQKQQLSTLNLTDESNPVENLWIVFDVERALSRSATEEELFRAYFENFPFCPPICRLLLIYRPEQKAVIYKLNPENNEISSNIIQTSFNYEKRIPPTHLTDQNGRKYTLIAYNDFFALYHDKKPELKDLTSLLVFIDDVLIENLTRIRLGQYKNILLGELLSLQELVKKVQKSENLKEFLESVVLALKKLVLLEKAFFVPCGSDNQPLFNRKLIKGPFIRLPEEYWNKSFEAAVKEAVSKKEKVVINSGNISIVAVPVLYNNTCFGVLGGITAHRTNLPLLTHLIELVALVLVLPLKEFLEKSSKTKEEIVQPEIESTIDLAELLPLLTEFEALAPDTDPSSTILKLEKLSHKLRQQLKVFLENNLKNGFPEKISNYLQILKRLFISYGVNLEYEMDITVEPQRYLEPLVTILIEALSNVAQHAEASNVNIKLESIQKGVVLEIKDDGRGFELKEALARIKSQPENYIGLRTMALLARKHGLKLKIKSEPSKGTEINLSTLNPEENK